MAADLVKGKGILKGIRAGKLLKGGGGLLQSAKAVATNPYVLATAAIAGTAVLANEVTGQRQAAPLQADRKAKEDRGKVLPVQGVGGVGDMGSPSPTGSLQGVDIGSDKRQNFEDGGEVSGPKGIDKVKANLTDGEFVVAAPAVKKIGVENLMAMNAMGGGDNKPKMKNGEMYAKGGGLVNPVPSQNIAKNKGGYAADTGLDILTPIGSKIVSPVSGMLEYAEKGHVSQMGQDANPDMPGNQDQHSVRIKLDRPFEYAGKKVNFYYVTHMYDLSNSIKNKTGIKIKAGQFLGKSGVANNTPHVHVGFVEDRAQNNFLNFTQVRSLLSGAGAGGIVSGEDEDIDHGDVATQENSSQTSDLVLSPEDAKMANAYLQYITQPQGRGLDILPTIDRVSAASSPPPPQINPAPRVPSGSATNPNNPQQIAAAAKRQLTGATR